MSYLKWSFIALLFMANVGVIVSGKKHFENKAAAAGGYEQTNTVSVKQAVYEDPSNRVVER
ncbi:MULTISPECIES: hypothetical protein [unclassified Paenibacillus]|uniref:hypothetical protein n=1 Tax=unclassified Paenibacillus TaxID=185978 RepID=UPI001AE48E75|nr:MULTISPECIES: hypothetical protein [unclassified Paenibacillus]MBP1154416.1 hypothetical protein [Paenibacillus sp. PvP091]MBP1170200.1 hypothetical protein [Paenibacillus sp. PvR098]MBP2441228.1 hypothetical protein [Paenibacillus sp. PvP052]